MSAPMNATALGFALYMTTSLLAPGGASAADLRVPEDFATIQKAVDAAAPFGDRIVVAGGSYSENVTIPGKQIDLDGAAQDKTTIGTVSWTNPSGGEFCGGRLDGFTILALEASDVREELIIVNCTIHDFSILESHRGAKLRVERCLFQGGGLEVTHDGSFAGGQPVQILDSLFLASDLTVRSGLFAEVERCHVESGLIHAVCEVLTLDDCSVENGGIQVRVDTQGGTISDNTVVGGSGISVSATSLAHLSVLRNEVRLCDAGLENDSLDSGTIDFEDNYVVGCEIGISAAAFRSRITGNLVVDCKTGVHAESEGDLRVESNTVVGCSSEAIQIDQPASMNLVIEKNIVVGNVAGFRLPGGVDSTIECNDVWNNSEGNWIGIDDPTGQDGNIAVDPEFCMNPADSYMLTRGSPCLPGNHPDGSDCGRIGARACGCPVAVSILGMIDRGRKGALSSAVARRTRQAEGPASIVAEPNPSSGSVWIGFTPTGTARTAVDLAIFDVQGRRLRTLATESDGSGLSRIHWDGRDHDGNDVGSGVYFAVAQTSAGCSVARFVRRR